MKILIGGGNGFIGQRLTRHLLFHGHEVVILDRNESRLSMQGLQSFKADLLRPELFEKRWFQGVDAVINLSGKNIFSLWTTKNRRAIRESRITANKNLVSFISALERKPKAFISASAVGYYGDRGDMTLTEQTSHGNGFLAEVCVAWEAEARKAEQSGLRSVQVRTAPVLERSGGMLAQVLKSFDFGLSFLFGSGTNWFSWIHMEDIVNAYRFVIEHESISGPVNASSPHPVRFRDFMNLLRQYRKALPIPIPAFVLKMVLQETADVVLFSQRMHPEKLLKAGFRFLYPTLGDALKEIFSQK
ncbi:MAG: TIGR01777 family oxidoreductase [Nitrospirota bacterium]